MLLYFHSPTQPSTQVYLCLSIFIAVGLFVFVAATAAFRESPSPHFKVGCFIPFYYYYAVIPVVATLSAIVALCVTLLWVSGIWILCNREQAHRRLSRH